MIKKTKAAPYRYALTELHVMTIFFYSEKELSDDWLESKFAEYMNLLKPSEERPVRLTVKVLSKRVNVISTPGRDIRIADAVEIA